MQIYGSHLTLCYIITELGGAVIVMIMTIQHANWQPAFTTVPIRKTTTANFANK